MTLEVEQVHDRRALLKDALLAVEQMQARLEAVERAKNEPIAIVGMSCRFPGAKNVEVYWNLLQNGQDAVRMVPPNRWNVDDYEVPDDGSGNKPVWYGGFLDDIDQFDPAFFGISPREAITLDPQQRLVLEVTWEALENAAISPDSLNGTRTGVFIGITTHDYLEIAKGVGLDDVDVYTATGNALNAAPGRVAYTLGLQGPSVAVDTACSSSLVALHLACQSLRSGESNLALAGGVNALLSPDGFVIFSRWGMMAKDGRCKTFDSSADGFVRGEGCGILVLKRLSDAQEAGDPILAVIHGSAVNQDGRSSGLTVPNGRAQQAVVRQALENAGVKPTSISYVEAHGTGTTLGDPIEIEALGAVLGEGRATNQPLIVGSVKTNLGHLESASGIAGVIKTILALQHREIPPHLHLHERSPRIPWPDFEIVIPSEPIPWQSEQGTRFAGVSSFGFSGTNAHVVLGEAPEVIRPAEVNAIEDRPLHLLTLSARTPQAIRDLGVGFQEYLIRSDAPPLADIAYTAAHRSDFSHRLSIIASDAADAAQKLSAFVEGRETAGVINGQVVSNRPKITFLFTGQGSQYVGMGQSLYRTQPVFRAALDECAQFVDKHLGQSLLDLIFNGPESQVNNTRFTQPVLFALEYALARMWQSWGVEPDFVMGHSVGEYVAVVVAGVMTLETGLELIAERGRLMSALPLGGQMAAVFAEEQLVSEVIAPYITQLSIAAVNAPDEIVISGVGEAVEAAISEFTQRGIKTRRLTVSHAFHSPLMEPMLKAFQDVVSKAKLNKPRIKIISNLTGAQAGSEITTPAYWVRHVREAVRFADSVAALHEAGCRIYLEVGPKPTLTGLGQRCVPDGQGVWLPTLREGREDWNVALNSLGRLYVEGVNIRWDGFDTGYPRTKVHLPVTYPFQRARYWVDTAKPRRKSKSTAHPLLGERLDLAHEAGTVIWQGELDLVDLAYLDDHRVQGMPIVPATAYMEIAMAAGREAFNLWPARLTEVENRKMLLLPPGTEPPVVQVVLKQRAEDEAEFAVYSRPSVGQGDWTLHATGVVSRIPLKDTTDVLEETSLEAIQERATQTLSGIDFYRYLHEKGNEWGPNFQGVETLWRGNGEGLSRIRVPDGLVKQLGRYQFHPAVSDACGHILAATVSLQKSDDETGGAFVGGGVRETRVYRNVTTPNLWAYARLQPDASDDPNILVGDVAVFDDDGNLISETLGARLWYLDHQTAQKLVERVDDWLYHVDWELLETQPSDATIAQKWLILADQSGFGEALAEQVVARGGHATIAFLQDAGFQQINDHCYSVDLAQESLQKLLAETQPDRILHLWVLDAYSDNVEMAQYLGPESVRALIHTLANLGETTTKISLVTYGSQAVQSDDVTNPVQAMLWGLGRSLAVEHAEWYGGLIDLDTFADAETNITNLLQSLSISAEEDQIAFRGGAAYGPRLTRMAGAQNASFRAHTDGAYLITGGLGGLGLVIARWLAEHGAQHLILMGRTPLPPREQWDDADPRFQSQIEYIRELESLGVTVYLAAVDVADEASLRAYLAEFAQTGLPIRGVFHAAGVMQYQPLREQTSDDLLAVLRAKVTGGWLLHSLLMDEPVDTFVLFSSTSALLSSPMMAGYAAANTYLDALAHYRQGQGLPALSINWGTWSDAGMATRFQSNGRATTVAGTMTSEQGLLALEKLMGNPFAQVAVLPIDWQAWQKQYPAFTRAPLLRRVIEVEAESQASGQQQEILASVLATSGVEQEMIIQTYLRNQLARILGFEPDHLDLTQSILSLGLDSLMAVELKNRIERDLRVVTPMVRLLQGPTTGELTSFVMSQLNDVVLDSSDEVEQTNWEEGAL